MSTMTPKEIVHELDKHIIGQVDAKRAVSIALRNRWRRSQLSAELAAEVTPKNILMIGPTGVGKTEIARRLAKLAKAPFIKVEATKFTEVGYVGRDVDSIIRDLMDIGIKQIREQAMEKVRSQAADAAEDRILDALLPTPRQKTSKQATDDKVEDNIQSAEALEAAAGRKESASRQLFRKKLRESLLDEKEIEINVAAAAVGVEIMSPPGMEEMTSQLQSLFQNINQERTKTRKMKVKDALKIITEEEAAKLINEDDLKRAALISVEQNGIVFIDEFDKIARRSDHSSGADVSREGVQRDLLPLIEGSTITTKHGMVKTDHILFIASGAFHVTKPSDLIPELQGRLPIRVELKALTTDDFVRILTEPDASLTEQYTALLETEGVKLDFTVDGIRQIAEIACDINDRTENIGARRLHTVIERVLEILSFEASDHANETFQIDAAYVKGRLAELLSNEDLSRYIL